MNMGWSQIANWVKIEHGQRYCSNAKLRYNFLDVSAPLESTDNLEEWYSGMDRFGEFVMLVMSLG